LDASRFHPSKSPLCITNPRLEPISVEPCRNSASVAPDRPTATKDDRPKQKQGHLKNSDPMKTLRILCTAATIAAALSTSVLAEDTTHPGGRGGPRGPRGQGMHRQGPPPEIVARYDANQDGQLDETERAALHADIEAGKVARPEGRGPGNGPRRQGPPPEIVARYDANQDGQLDEAERAALHADIEAGKVARPEGRGPGNGPRRQGPPPEIVARYDANQDGQLDETERAALHADIEAGKVARPEGRGPGAGSRKGRGRH
jgi:hypothetical protein